MMTDNTMTDHMTTLPDLAAPLLQLNLEHGLVWNVIMQSMVPQISVVHSADKGGKQ
jgi:hypothetical protein